MARLIPIFARFLVLVPILTGCALLTETPRQTAIDLALLQPDEMPLDWDFNWENTNEGQCEGRRNSFRYDVGYPNVTHIIWDCPSEDAAKTLVYKQSSPDLQSNRSHIGEDSKPAHANEYMAYCDTTRYKMLIGKGHEESMKNCTTITRYGRVVSMMMVNSIFSAATWPLETDLLKWTIERNDAKLVKLAK